MRIDTSPQGKLCEAFLGTAFLAHPYGRPIVGWESDISRVTRKDAEQFFKDHYDISRLVLSIVGDVKTGPGGEECKAKWEGSTGEGGGEDFEIEQGPPQ